MRVLASGSSGNALYVTMGDVRLLIDVGVPIRSLSRSIGEMGADPSALTAVLITHAHSDHVRGLPALCAKWPSIPVYATTGAARRFADGVGPASQVHRIRDHTPVVFGDVRVVPFAVDHDAAETVGFRIDCGDFGLGVATDIGGTTPAIDRLLSGCRVLVIEANHDDGLLRNGSYPDYLKRRIASRSGHLSNHQAGQLLADVAGPKLEHVILAHLSDENNRPELAVEAAASALADWPLVQIRAARQSPPGPIMTFDCSPGAPPDLPGLRASGVVETSTTVLQPRLFE